MTDAHNSAIAARVWAEALSDPAFRAGLEDGKADIAAGRVRSFADVAVWHKPEGRGRGYRRKARGLARRLRLWFVRDTKWEQAHPEALRSVPTYGPPWTSDNALADYSFACTCHKRERYDRRKAAPPTVVMSEADFRELRAATAPEDDATIAHEPVTED